MATLTINQTTPFAQSRAPAHIRPSASQYDNFEGNFAFARIHDSICLIQTNQLLSKPLFLAPVDVPIFRQEFGTMFRYSHTATVNACDIQVLIEIDRQQILSEETGVVFVAKEVTDKLIKWTRRRSSPPQRTWRR